MSTAPSEIDANEMELGEIDPMILQATGVLENILVEEVLPVEWFTEFLELEQPNIEPEALEEIPLDNTIPWVSLPASMEMETSPKESVPELWEELSAVTSTEELELLVDTPALPSLLADDDLALLFASNATAPETTLADENDDTLLVYLAFAARLNRFTVSAASQQSKPLEFLKTEEATFLHHELNVTLVNLPQ